MNKIILDKTQLHDLIFINKYQVTPKNRLISRCIDGRYDNKIKDQKSKIKNKDQSAKIEEKQIPALAIPGADAGELALVMAAANNYGLEMDQKTVWQSLVEVVGGENNLRFHTDSHAEKNQALAGCGHIKQIRLDPKAYGLESDQVDFIKTKFQQAKNKGIKETVLHGEHGEGAVVMISGNWGVYPQYYLKDIDGNVPVQVFIYHRSLIDERHRLLARKLIENKAVVVPMGCGAQYLYEALSTVGEDHLLETAKRLAKGLPIYSVNFKDDGSFKIEEMETV